MSEVREFDNVGAAFAYLAANPEAVLEVGGKHVRYSARLRRFEAKRIASVDFGRLTKGFAKLCNVPRVRFKKVKITKTIDDAIARFGCQTGNVRELLKFLELK